MATGGSRIPSRLWLNLKNKQGLVVVFAATFCLRRVSKSKIVDRHGAWVTLASTLACSIKKQRDTRKERASRELCTVINHATVCSGRASRLNT